MSTPVTTDSKKKIKRGFFAVITGRTFLIALLLLAQVGLLLWGFERLGDAIHFSSAIAAALIRAAQEI